VDVTFELMSKRTKFAWRRRVHRRQIAGPLDARRPQMGQRGAVRLADRGIATHHRDVAEVGGPLEPVIAGNEDLATPDGAIAAVAGAVEGEADDPLVRRYAVLHHNCGDVRVVVLDQFRWSLGVLVGPESGPVCRMRVRGHTLRVDLVHLVELPG